MADPVHIGAHTVCTEGDVVQLRMNGNLSPAESLEFHRHVGLVLTALKRVFILFDYRKGTYIGPDTRRCVAEWNQTNKVSAVAVYGVNPVTRAVATLLSSAVQKLRGEPLDVAFFKDETAARAWLDEKRRQLLGAASVS